MGRVSKKCKISNYYDETKCKLSKLGTSWSQLKVVKLNSYVSGIQKSNHAQKSRANMNSTVQVADNATFESI